MNRPTKPTPSAGPKPPTTANEALTQHFTALAEALPQIVWFDDAVGRTQYVNRHWLEYTGLTVAESLEYGMRQAVHPDDLPAAQQIWASYLRESVSFEHELRLRRADEQYCWHLCRNSPVHNPVGDLIGWFGTAHDIDERKQASEQIRFQANLLETVEQAVIVTDLAGTITFWNRYAETLYGWSASAAIGRQILDLTPSLQSYAEAEKIMGRLAQGQSWSGELWAKRHDGSTFLAYVTDSPILNEAGELLGIVGVSVDITARKRQEQQLRFLAEASVELSSSLNFRQTLQRVADLVVPGLADWCSVDMLTAAGEVEQVAVAHVDPAKVAWARQLRVRYPVDPNDPQGVAHVLRIGEAFFYPNISPAMIDAADVDEEGRRILQELGLRSMMIVPMRGLGSTVGALTLVWSDTDAHYTEEDVVFAEELARRAAFAIDNARLYSEAQAAEARQAEVLAQLESLLSSAPIGFAFFDRKHRYVRINQQFAEINGLAVDDHLGRPLGDLLPLNARLIDPILERVFATAEPVSNLEITGEIANQPGVVHHWLTSFFPVMSDGQPRFVGATMVNITARKQVEAALRDSEERFRSTFEQAAVGMAHVGLDGRWLSVNNRLCEILNYRREELLKLTFQEITHPDDLSQDVAVLQRLLANELDGYQAEKRYLRRDGSIVWIALTVSTQRNRLTNQLEYFISVVEDISERKQATIRLNIVAEASRVLTTSLSPEQRAQTVAELLVPNLAEWCLVNLLHQQDRPELVAVAHRQPEQVAQMWATAHRSPLTMTGDNGTPFVIRSGRSIFFPQLTPEMFAQDNRLRLLQAFDITSLMIVPLRARGQTLGAMTLMRCDSNHPFVESDLAFAEELGRRMGLAVDNARLYQEARDAEARFRHLSETLEQRVAERTAELERSNRDLDQFAYVASHDLKAPLRAIENLSVWIEEDAEGALPPPVQDHLIKLRNRVQRMERLLDDLLAYSRAGRIQHRPELLEISGLIKGVLELQSIPPEFQVTFDQTSASIYTVHVPLETVLRNLVGNAIKHHDRADGHVHIYITEQTASLQICVEDDGPGIAPQFHQRIFEMFQTLQPRDEREGSGIGLTIVKKIIEHVGGEIWVESTEGQGSRFCFTWPHAAGSADSTLAIAEDESL